MPVKVEITCKVDTLASKAGIPFLQASCKVDILASKLHKVDVLASRQPVQGSATAAQVARASEQEPQDV